MECLAHKSNSYEVVRVLGALEIGCLPDCNLNLFEGLETFGINFTRSMSGPIQLASSARFSLLWPKLLRGYRAKA